MRLGHGFFRFRNPATSHADHRELGERERVFRLQFRYPNRVADRIIQSAKLLKVHSQRHVRQNVVRIDGQDLFEFANRLFHIALFLQCNRGVVHFVGIRHQLSSICVCDTAISRSSVRVANARYSRDLMRERQDGPAMVNGTQRSDRTAPAPSEYNRHIGALSKPRPCDEMAGLTPRRTALITDSAIVATSCQLVDRELLQESCLRLRGTYSCDGVAESVIKAPSNHKATRHAPWGVLENAATGMNGSGEVIMLDRV